MQRAARKCHSTYHYIK